MAGLLLITFIMFIGKMLGYVNPPWHLVFAPLWVPAVFTVIALMWLLPG